jgi:hypothetical protein
MGRRVLNQWLECVVREQIPYLFVNLAPNTIEEGLAVFAMSSE